MSKVFKRCNHENEDLEIKNIESFGDVLFQNNEEIKNCPFCGGKAWLGMITYSDGDTYYSPECSNCKASWNEAFETEKEAVFTWNKREYNKE